MLEATRDVLTLARERFAVRDYHGAVLLLTEAARERALYADALNLLGLSLAMIDRTQDALQAFDDALERYAARTAGLVAVRLVGPQAPYDFVEGT